MPGLRLDIRLAILLVVAVLVPAASAVAQPPGKVRVVNRPAPIQRWFRQPVTDVLAIVEPETTLEVLDQENGWYWVVVPPDAHGTRRAGWINSRLVEPVTTVSPKPGATPSAAAASVSATEPVAEDRVTITARQGEGSAGSVPSVTRSYTFEDVHFDRDRFSVRQQDAGLLDAAVAALKADPLLTVNLEGYTCDLGSAEYNLALGVRRANAVKSYLISQGIAAERLHTISLGEDRAKHDNSSEETRMLNRRVAVVPAAKR